MSLDSIISLAKTSCTKQIAQANKRLYLVSFSADCTDCRDLMPQLGTSLLNVTVSDIVVPC